MADLKIPLDMDTIVSTLGGSERPCKTLLTS